MQGFRGLGLRYTACVAPFDVEVQRVQASMCRALSRAKRLPHFAMVYKMGILRHNTGPCIQQ